MMFIIYNFFYITEPESGTDTFSESFLEESTFQTEGESERLSSSSPNKVGVGLNEVVNTSDLDNDLEIIESLMKNKYPTDKAHFDKMNVSGRIKSFIVKTGS